LADPSLRHAQQHGGIAGRKLRGEAAQEPTVSRPVSKATSWCAVPMPTTFITHWRYHLLLIVRYYWSMAISGGEYLVTTARDLGAALKHFRTEAGVTQADAAEAMGVGQPYLSSLEGGQFGSSLTHALRLLRFVGCEVIVRPRERRG
jgi:DNA-binding XRE family transcriptional regulator